MSKGALAQGGIHSPAVVTAPGLGLAPGRSDALIAALDIAPFFFELAGGAKVKTVKAREEMLMKARSFAAILRVGIEATGNET